jgi:membrane complex biogenesis BtpA family protein
MSLKSLVHATPSPLVIGMLHVPALPGTPGSALTLKALRDRVLDDAAKLADAGVNALMIENFGDIPFFPGRVGHETVAYLTMLALAVRHAHHHLPLGINVLRNDGLSALAVAHASGAGYIRVNVLCAARVTDQGILQGIAHDLLRLRKQLGAEAIEILADVDVKHSAPLGAPRPIEVEVEDVVHRGLADALVVSGTGTGKATDPRKLAAVKAAAGNHAPVFVGSGASLATVAELAPHADGFIVGTSLKESANPGGPIDPAKAAHFVQFVKTLTR